MNIGKGIAIAGIWFGAALIAFAVKEGIAVIVLFAFFATWVVSGN